MLINNNLGSKTGLALCLVMAMVGCNDSNKSSAGADYNTGILDNTDDKNDDPHDFDQKKLLADLSQYVLLPAVQGFEQASQTLLTASTDYCQSIELNKEDTDTHRQAAQQAWIYAMNQWQQLEVMQVGPLADNDGKLRNALYSWPVTSQCAVDQDVGHFENGTINGSAYDITKRTATRRGLDAAEYLLFTDNQNHACSSDNLAPNGWNSRSDQERLLARCKFSVELASDILNSAKELTAAWTLEQSGFQSVLNQAGETDNRFETAKAAINHITDAMFYIDSTTKDAKLAKPIGLTQANSCGNAACIDDIESELSDNAINNVNANLVALQSIFLGAPVGTDAVGFDDYLVAVDQAVLAATMANDIQAAIAATEAFSGTMTDAVSTSPDKVQTLHQAVKLVTDNMKSMFITYLSLELPLTSAGDAD